MTGRRIVSVWLPQFAMERWQRAMARLGNAPSEDLPVVLAIQGPHGPVIHAVNRAARMAGVQSGARVVDMNALCPTLKVEYADPGGDQASLEKLVFWARRWCPWTAQDGDGLLLDISGSQHLWGGEAQMLAEIEGQLSLAGYSARLAVAPTPGAAWALARYGTVRHVCHDTADLRPLPMAALRLEAETLLLLHRLGLKTIGALADLPRLSLTRRFSRTNPAANPLLRLDQAMGRLTESLSCPGEPADFRSMVRLPEPIFDPTHFLPGLCQDLCNLLAAQNKGCRRLRLTLYRTDGDWFSVVVATSTATRDDRHLAKLFEGKLDQIEAGFGFDMITLEALAVEPLAPAQARLEGGEEDTLALAQLIDRLSSRFGARSITRPAPRQSHVPERAQTRGDVLTAPAPVKALAAPAPLRIAGTPPAPVPKPPVPTDRPIRLLDHAEEIGVLYAVPEGPPAQFVWRRQTHRVTRYEGPERIAPEWWHDRPGTRLRDYFKVEDEAGRRFWLYREGVQEDGRGGDPRWFLHGIFA